LDKTSPFHVAAVLDLLGGLVQRHRDFWLTLGRLESRLLAHELDAVPISLPVYVCGLARSGSTLLHHLLAAHPAVATHRARDFPLVFTPYLLRLFPDARFVLPASPFFGWPLLPELRRRLPESWAGRGNNGKGANRGGSRKGQLMRSL
jgi:Sulfotransferase family